MEIQSYLERINIDLNINIDVNFNSLKLIQKQHLLTVPFENLDIHLNNNIKTDVQSLYRKIVIEKRGGICYELNWLLSYLLKSIGFSVKVLGGKVIEPKGSYFDHMLILVNLNEKKYIVDVGFGDNFLEPLEFELDIVQKDNKGLFKIVSIDKTHFELMKYSQELNNFKREYIFKTKEMQMNNFKDRINYFTHNDESIFKKNIFCSLEKEDGRISLKHDKLISTNMKVKSIEKINSSNEYIIYLNDKFKIQLDPCEYKKIKKIWKKKSSEN
ncbi:arylamine N-acetyltransferase [Clostridium sp. D2Q-11]|uniref:Arylamine N-acetyltransferase n=1 Tax=Anaeromonas frigoriresistens TaxID=2683708 RepID=A0A942Z7R2_9FIRM|nr:arylamine N-acetyltransferase [Anaeromonas frigoriresistens]MBS4537518.1 arylamine N-acetyltransferase [Anaeromonas frigoriresistens]